MLYISDGETSVAFAFIGKNKRTILNSKNYGIYDILYEGVSYSFVLQ